MNFSKHPLFAIIGALLLVSSVVKAAEDPTKFQARKDQETSHLQERLQLVQEHLSCVQAATDHAALKTCNEAAKTKGQAFEAKLKAEHGK